MNELPVPDLRQFVPFRGYAEAGSAGARFPTTASLRWFTNQHRTELVKLGVLIPGKGSAPTLIRQDFPQVAAAILIRDAQ